jgi:uncharacterized protein YbjQ (UPF0145 family)
MSTCSLSGPWPLFNHYEAAKAGISRNFFTSQIIVPATCIITAWTFRPKTLQCRFAMLMTGLSGNEIYCLRLKGLEASELLIGNGVYSMGFLGGLGANWSGLIGGEVRQVTDTVAEGRRQSFNRLMAESLKHGAHGVTGVSSDLRTFKGNIEFLSVASAVKETNRPPTNRIFSSSADGQELYCQMDAGYAPLTFAFGNVAYSMGLGGGILGGLKTLARGEIKEYSDVFNRTRHLALDRLVQDAKAVGANAVVGIETHILPFKGFHEMFMMGTASHNPQVANVSSDVVTSDLTCQELWNMTSLGYLPLKLVLGTAVYSLGVIGGLKSILKSIVRGEISDLTTMIYDAREHAIGLIRDEAAALGADEVVGIKTQIHEIGGMIEFMAIGTAMKKVSGVATATAQLPPQAIINDKDTWISREDMLSTEESEGRSNEGSAASGVLELVKIFGR